MALLERFKVQADNSCLFTSVARLCEGVTDDLPLKNAGRRLRTVCAEAAASDPDPTMKALLLGHETIEAYGRWITLDHNWGGEPEVLMLAAHFGVEIAICSCESMSFLRYSDESSGSSKGTVHLLYTGQHYDPLIGPDGTLVFPPGSNNAALEASALEIAKVQNEDARKRSLEKRVNRLKCSGCGAILDDAAAFQEHCTVVEHDDDFTYDCEQVEIVIQAGEALPEGSVDLNAPDVHAFYNASSADALSLSMRCAAAPFVFPPPSAGDPGTTHATLEDFWRAAEAAGETLDRRRQMLAEAIDVQYRTEAAATSGLRAHLLETAPKTLICVDIDPWLGMQASGGISAGQNGLGKALMKTREELLSEAAA